MEQEYLQVRQVAQLPWDRSAQLIGSERESFKVGEITQLPWDRSAQIVTNEREGFEVGQVAQLPWDRSRQVVFLESQFDNVAIWPSVHAVPSPHGSIAHPIVVVRPVRPARGVVERNEGRAIGRHAALEVADVDDTGSSTHVFSTNQPC